MKVSTTLAFALVLGACGQQRPPAPSHSSVSPAAFASSPSSISPSSDASAPLPHVPDRPSPFHVIVRAPLPIGLVAPIDTIGAPLPFVARTPGGGLVFACEYAHATASGDAALRIDAMAPALHKLLPGRFMGESADGTRWIRADKPGDALISRETWDIGGGPRTTTYRQCGSGWSIAKRNASYTNLTRHDEALLAIEQRVRSDGSDHATGTGGIWHLELPRLARIDGRGVLPTVPERVCPVTMSSASDGTLLVVGYECIGPTTITCAAGAECQWTPPEAPKPTIDVGHYAPGLATTTFEQLVVLDEEPRRHPAALAVSRDELYVAAGGKLHTFDGKRWSASPIPSQQRQEAKEMVIVHALARSPSGALWMALIDGAVGRLLTRARGASTWTPVPLPRAPEGPLDDGEPPSTLVREAFYGSQLPLPNRGDPLPIVPLWIDATNEAEILVLGRAGDTTEKEPVYPPGITPGMKWTPTHRPGEGYEIVLLSTKARAPVLRVPSQLAQVLAMDREAGAKRPQSAACTARPIEVAIDPRAALMARSSGGPGGLTCCVDQAFYDCADEAACYGFDHQACVTACSRMNDAQYSACLGGCTKKFDTAKRGRTCKRVPAKDSRCGDP